MKKNDEADEQQRDTWGEDLAHPIAAWKHEVANDDTRLGYWSWVEHQHELWSGET